MTDIPASQAWPKGRSEDQRLVEKMAHIFYRDAVLLVDPNVALAEDVAQRLRALGLSTRRMPVTREFLEEIREPEYYPTDSKFVSDSLAACFNVAALISRLENMRDFEQDMTTRLESRLKSLRMLQKWDDREKIWVWTLQMNEHVQQGLKGKMSSKKNQGKRKVSRKDDQGDNSDAMEIDG
jgi:hypothetical protein